MSKIISTKTLQRARERKMAKDAILSFFTRVPHIDKNCQFVIAKLGKCKIYIPVSNIDPEKVYMVVPELQNMYTIFEGK